MQIKSYYGERAKERRKQFNSIIHSCNMVLMNNIPEIDPDIWENWQGETPTSTDECEWFLNDSKPVKRWCCNTHMYQGDENETKDTEHPEMCDFAESDIAEVYQWYAVGDSDAEFLKRHNQYITYSDLLDTYFLAITHFGTGWDYVDSMVDDFEDCYHGLEDYPDAE